MQPSCTLGCRIRAFHSPRHNPTHSDMPLGPGSRRDVDGFGHPRRPLRPRRPALAGRAAETYSEPDHWTRRILSPRSRSANDGCKRRAVRSPRTTYNPRTSMALEPGFRLDAYEIVRPLGSGGMGEVWLATEVRLARKVALKVLPADLTRDPSRVQRFEQEARAASALNHPNVCTILALGETSEGQHYIAMEYVEGETLRQRLSRTALPLREALDIAIQGAAALSAAHTARSYDRRASAKRSTRPLRQTGRHPRGVPLALAVHGSAGSHCGRLD